ncbi:STAS domain-containing protein [Streptomyces sp. NPDC093260]|uniref:STAS domain-containing protein n=1 Tax=Streptomyces sp. NPDC093260 TaxID=3155073 RepID=UPI00342422BC
MADTQFTDPAPEPAGLSATATLADGGVRVVTLAGEIDHHTGDTLRHALDATDGTSRIVADLGQVTFMDSSGTNILLTAHRDTASAGGWLRLAAPTPTVLRTLQLVGIDESSNATPRSPTHSTTDPTTTAPAGKAAGRGTSSDHVAMVASPAMPMT